jgi:hypothetical protein
MFLPCLSVCPLPLSDRVDCVLSSYCKTSFRRKEKKENMKHANRSRDLLLFRVSSFPFSLSLFPLSRLDWS